MFTTGQHQYPYDNKIFNGYALSLTQLFGPIHFATGAVIVVLLPPQQWLLHVLLSHVCDIVSVRSLFPITCINHSNPEKIIRKDSHLLSAHWRIRKVEETNRHTFMHTIKGGTLGPVLVIMQKYKHDNTGSVLSHMLNDAT